MFENLIENDFDLYVTYGCNWNCEYCIVDTHNQRNISRDDLINKIQKIPNNSVVKILGGEPGMLIRKDVDLILKSLLDKDCEIMLSTNGLFLEKYPEHIKSFKNILYHCSEDLDGDFKKYNYDNIEYQIVVSDNNIKNLRRFLDDNDLNFSIYASAKSPIDVPGNTLSKRNAINIIRRYKDRINPKSFKSLLGRCDKESTSL